MTKNNITQTVAKLNNNLSRLQLNDWPWTEILKFDLDISNNKSISYYIKNKRKRSELKTARLTKKKYTPLIYWGGGMGHKQINKDTWSYDWLLSIHMTKGKHAQLNLNLVKSLINMRNIYKTQDIYLRKILTLNILKLKPTCLQLYFFLNIREAFRLILWRCLLWLFNFWGRLLGHVPFGCGFWLGVKLWLRFVHHWRHREVGDTLAVLKLLLSGNETTITLNETNWPVAHLLYY